MTKSLTTDCHCIITFWLDTSRSSKVAFASVWSIKYSSPTYHHTFNPVNQTRLTESFTCLLNSPIYSSPPRRSFPPHLINTSTKLALYSKFSTLSIVGFVTVLVTSNMIQKEDTIEKAPRVQWTDEDIETGRSGPVLHRTKSNTSVHSNTSRRGSIDPASAFPIQFRTISYQINETKEKESNDAKKAKVSATKGMTNSRPLLGPLTVL